MTKVNENHIEMALRMRTVNIPDDIIEDLTGVKLQPVVAIMEPDDEEEAPECDETAEAEEEIALEA